MAPVALTGAGNVTAAESSSTDTLTAAKPANLADGDVLWAAGYFRNDGGSLSAPAGWTAAKSDTGNASVGLWVKPIPTASTEPADYTFSVSGVGSSRSILLIGRITGADTASPVDAAGAASVYTGTSSLVHPSVTAVADDCLLLTVSTCNLNVDTPPVFTADAAMTEVAQEDIIGSSSSMQVAQEALTSAGSTGTRTATMSPSANNSAGFMVTIAAGAEAHAGSGSISGSLALDASGTPDVAGSGAVAGSLALSGTGTIAVGGAGGVAGLLTLSARGTADTGIGLPPRPRTRWQLVLGPADGGHALALTEAGQRRYTARLTGNSDLGFHLDGRHPQAEAIEELETDVHLLFTNASGSTQILDRCRVGPTRDTIGDTSHQVDVTCLDYRAVLARRILYSTDTLAYSATDQAEIAWGLVSDTQAQEAGRLGISKGWAGTAPTGVALDRTFEAGDDIAELIDKLAETQDGFDWDVSPVSASALQLDVWHPMRGADRGVVLLLGGIAAQATRDVDPSGYANAVRYTGTDGLTAAELEAADLAQAGLWPQGRWDAVFGDDGLKTQPALDARAAWQLAQSQVVRPAWTVTLRQGAWDGPDHIWLGDWVRLVIPSGRLATDTRLRVHEIALSLDGDGGEDVQLTLGGPRPDFTRWPSRVDRRLKNLERR